MEDNNYDNAFTTEPAEPATNAFGAADIPAPAYTTNYNDLTEVEKFKAHKEAIYRKHGITQETPTMSIADAIKAAESNKIQVHQDGSMTVAKGVMGNQKDSLAMIKILREQAYARHNITD
jgi:hypothetical protein